MEYIRYIRYVYRIVDVWILSQYTNTELLSGIGTYIYLCNTYLYGLYEFLIQF